MELSELIKEAIKAKQMIWSKFEKHYYDDLIQDSAFYQKTSVITNEKRKDINQSGTVKKPLRGNKTFSVIYFANVTLVKYHL